MTRRDFLRGAAGVAASALAGPLPASSAEEPMPAIDSHVHFVDPTRPEGAPWPPRTDVSIYRPHLPPVFEAMTAAFRILGEVVIEASPRREDNQWELDLARRHPSIVAYVGHVEPGTPDFVRDLDRFGANPLFRGIRLDGAVLHRATEPAWARDLSILAERGYSLDIVNGTPAVEAMHGLARREPRLRLIIDHLPFTIWDDRPAAMKSALAGLGRCPNVYAKVSKVLRLVNGRNSTDPALYRPALDVLWETFGRKRLLYASNWPASARTATYPEIYRVVARYYAGLSRGEREDFYWRNSIAAYDWVARGPAAALRSAL